MLMILQRLYGGESMAESFVLDDGGMTHPLVFA